MRVWIYRCFSKYEGAISTARYTEQAGSIYVVYYRIESSLYSAELIQFRSNLEKISCENDFFTPF